MPDMDSIPAEDYVRSHQLRDEEMMFLVGRIGKLVDALTEIAKGEGAFSRDPLTHATNTIESMKQIARDALSTDQPADQPTT